MGSRPPSSSLSITVRKGRLQLATLASGGDDDKGGTTVGSVHSFFIHYTRLGSLGWKKRKRWYRDNNNNERILYFPSLQLIKKNGNYNENTIFFYPIIIIVVTIGWAESEERAQPHPFPPGSLPRVVHRRKWVCRDYIMGSVLPHARPSLVLTSLLHASLLHSSVNTRRRPAAVPSSRAAMVRGSIVLSARWWWVERKG